MEGSGKDKGKAPIASRASASNRNNGNEPIEIRTLIHKTTKVPLGGYEKETKVCVVHIMFTNNSIKAFFQAVSENQHDIKLKVMDPETFRTSTAYMEWSSQISILLVLGSTNHGNPRAKNHNVRNQKAEVNERALEGMGILCETEKETERHRVLFALAAETANERRPRIEYRTQLDELIKG
ncbi:hypothetical protein MMC14_010402 [Varicellaria rhodocarpa]|nr:hypothetical protein [Varicellaria rhodocarpa]